MTARTEVWLKRLALLRPEYAIMGWKQAVEDEPAIMLTPQFLAFTHEHRAYFSNKSNEAVLRAIGSPLQHNAHCETFNATLDIPRIARAYFKGY